MFCLLYNNNLRIRSFSNIRFFSSQKSVKEKYDLIVIGGGSGGLATARRASGYKAKVLLIEAGRENDGMGLGGTCVNFGCVPKKVMFNAALHAEMLHTAKDYGFSFDTPTFDWAVLKKKRDEFIFRLNGIYKKNLSNDGVDLVEGRAKLIQDKKVEVNGVVYEGEHIVISVGGKPETLKVPGGTYSTSSDDFFKFENLPKKVGIIGAGYIAVELAGVLNKLGSETFLFIRKSEVLRNFDSIIQQSVTNELTKNGINLITNSIVKNITLNEKNLLKSIKIISNSNEIEFEGFNEIITAIGRVPLTSNIGLENVGVEVDVKGFVKVDKFQNTSVKGIYAVGDITTNGWELTPVAIASGRRLADRLFGGLPNARLDFDKIPSVVFSHPTVGSIGYSEQKAIEKFGNNVKVYNATFTDLYYSITEPQNRTKTWMKLVCVGENEKVIGLHVVGKGADEMIQGFGVAIKMGATKSDFDSCVAIHPTASEELVTMGKWGTIRGQPILPASYGLDV